LGAFSEVLGSRWGKGGCAGLLLGITTFLAYTVIMSSERDEKIDTSDIPELDEAFFREAEVRLPDNTEDKRWGKPHPASLADRKADGETDDLD
jgi:hypothetical protein